MSNWANRAKDSLAKVDTTPTERSLRPIGNNKVNIYYKFTAPKKAFDRARVLEAGTTIVGEFLETIIDQSTNPKFKGKKSYNLKTEADGVVNLPGCFELNRDMENATPGMQLKVTYIKKEVLPNGNDVHRFNTVELKY